VFLLTDAKADDTLYPGQQFRLPIHICLDDEKSDCHIVKAKETPESIAKIDVSYDIVCLHNQGNCTRFAQWRSRQIIIADLDGSFRFHPRMNELRQYLRTRCPRMEQSETLATLEQRAEPGNADEGDLRSEKAIDGTQILLDLIP
jgi:hypothetical protein